MSDLIEILALGSQWVERLKEKHDSWKGWETVELRGAFTASLCEKDDFVVHGSRVAGIMQLLQLARNGARTHTAHARAHYNLIGACTQTVKTTKKCTNPLRRYTFANTHVARSPSPAPWLPSGWFVSRDPGYSARLNKSHQVGSDSSHVDGTPNVIWRLGEHEIGPSSASSDTLSRCDVVLSLDASVLALYLSFFFVTHTDTHTHAHTLIHAKQSKNTLWHTVPADILSFCAKQGPSVQPPTPYIYPLRLFVLFFMFHFPSAYPWSLLSL